MMFNTNIAKQTISLAGNNYNASQLSRLPQHNEFDLALQAFLVEWFNQDPYITVYSSGSTGQPKALKVAKQKMINSAVMTCRFLKLKRNNKALLCLPLSYIAGKMMVVRALVAGLDLYLEPPTSTPLQQHDIGFDFVAMIPLQVYQCLETEQRLQRFKAIKHLLIGGGAIDVELSKKLQDFPNNLYATYGMAETVSHIAVRRLSQPYYTPFEGVSLSLSQQQTLVIDAPLLAEEIITTSDRAEINANGEFYILGRIDNVINTGGIKLQAEAIEAKLQPYIKGHFAIAGQADTKLGERLVLVTECSIDQAIFNQLASYERPKAVYQVAAIPLTSSQKINRAAVKQLVAGKLK